MNGETYDLPAPEDFDLPALKLKRMRAAAQRRMETTMPEGTFHDRYGYVGPGLGQSIMAALDPIVGKMETREADTLQAELNRRMATSQGAFLQGLPQDRSPTIAELAPGLQLPGLREVITAQVGKTFGYPEERQERTAKEADRLAREEENRTFRRSLAELSAVKGIESARILAGKPPAAPSGFQWADPTAPRQGVERIPGMPPVDKLPAARQKAVDDADTALRNIDDALQLVEQNPDAVGLKTMVPDIVLNRMDPEGTVTRAAIAGLSAERLHSMLGAAQTTSEFARLRPNIPAPGDDMPTVKRKLTALRKQVQNFRDVHGAAPAPPPPAEPTQAVKPKHPPGTRGKYRGRDVVMGTDGEWHDAR